MLGEPQSFSKIVAVIDVSNVPREEAVQRGGASDSGNGGHGKVGRASCPPSFPQGYPLTISCPVSAYRSLCGHGMDSCLTRLLPWAGSVFKVTAGYSVQTDSHTHCWKLEKPFGPGDPLCSRCIQAAVHKSSWFCPLSCIITLTEK